LTSYGCALALFSQNQSPLAAKSSSGNGISLRDEPDVSVLLAHPEIWHLIDLPERT
jgi:hypothetical protein